MAITQEGWTNIINAIPKDNTIMNVEDDLSMYVLNGFLILVRALM